MLARGLILFAAREFIERRSTQPKGVPGACTAHSETPDAAGPRTAAPTIKLLALAIASLLFGSWVFGSLGLEVWWLLTGRGPGGRLLAAGAVAPRAYKFRTRTQTAH
jgi:hypothetical protein